MPALTVCCGREGVRAVAYRVQEIAGLCVPPKVLEPIVGRIAIVVASHHACWSRSYECCQDEDVYMFGGTPPAGFEVNELISEALGALCHQPLWVVATDAVLPYHRSCDPSYATLVGDLVIGLPSDDG